MAAINQDLLERLTRRLDLSKASVYALIQELSAKNRVARHLGALLLAGDNGLSIQKYATAQDLADLRGVHHHVPVSTAPAQAPSQPRGLPKSRARSKRTKENTVFVIHGRDAKLRDSVYGLLRALGLEVKEWGHAIRAAKHSGPTTANR
jgi:hypothetical protein